MTYRMRGFALAALLLMCSSAAASAATCLVNPGKPQLAAVTAFEADPAAALANFTKGGGALVSYVRGLVITNPDMAAKLVAVYATLNPEQKAALGTGLGIAAGVCTAQAPDAALDIQKAVVLLNDPSFTAAFAGVIGDVPLGALGSGGAGSGSAGSSAGSGSVGSGSAGDGGTGAGGVSNASGTKSAANVDVIGGGGGGRRTTNTIVFVPVSTGAPDTIPLATPVTTVTTARLPDSAGSSTSPTLP